MIPGIFADDFAIQIGYQFLSYMGRISKSEMSLLCFDVKGCPIRLSKSYVSLNDLKPRYISFRGRQARTMRSYYLYEAWSDRFEFTPTTPNQEITMPWRGLPVNK